MTLLELHDRILLRWQKLPEKWKAEIISAFYTFATASFVEAGVQYHAYGNALPTKAGVLFAIFIACLRSGIKAVGALVFVELSAWLAARKEQQP